jgi:hypothetical protein
MREVEVRPLTNRLTESNTWFTGGTVDVIFTAHALDVDFQVEFAHAGYDCLDGGMRMTAKRKRERAKVNDAYLLAF